jgi:hypothetical protein
MSKSIIAHLHSLRSIRARAQHAIEIFEKIKHDLGTGECTAMIAFITEIVWQQTHVTDEMLLEIASMIEPFTSDVFTYTVAIPDGDDITITYVDGEWVEVTSAIAGQTG